MHLIPKHGNGIRQNPSRAKLAAAKWLALLMIWPLTACNKNQIHTVDITSTVMGGELLLNSSPYSGNGGSPVNLERGALLLAAESIGGDDIALGALGDADYQLNLVDDNYRPVYRYEQASVLPQASTEMTPALVISTPTSSSGLPVNPNTSLPDLLDTANPAAGNVNVPAVGLALQIQLNNQDFPTDASEVAGIYLKLENDTHLIYLGNTNGSLATVTLIPGRYDVIYQYFSGTRVPRNEHHVLETINLTNATVGSIRTEQLNVEAVDIRARFSLDGSDFPISAYDYGLLSLRNGEDQVQLGESFTQFSSARVIQGDYSAHYSAREIGSQTPANPDALFQDGIVIDNTTTTLNLNVPTTTIYGSFLINGTAPPASAYEYGRIHLRDMNTDASLLLGDTFAQIFEQIRVVPGAYQCEYTFREGGDVVPVNSHLILPEVLAVRESGPTAVQRIDCNIPVARITAELTLNGEPFPNSAYDFADILMRRVDNGDEIDMGETFSSALSANVIAGDYDLVYRVQEANGSVPINSDYRFITAYNVINAATLSHDFVTRSIQLVPTLNGSSFPESAYRYAEISIGSQPGERIQTNLTYEPAQAVKVITGEYAVYYSAMEVDDGLEIPVNKNAKVATINVN